MERTTATNDNIKVEIARLEEVRAMNPGSSLVPAVENRIAWLQKLLQESEIGE